VVKKVSICDSSFLPHTKSASIGGDNIGVGPTYFEWELTDVESARFVTDAHIKDAPGKGQIAWLLEPSGLHPEDYAAAMEKPFDAVLTHNLDYCYRDNWLYYPYGGSWIDFDSWFCEPKTERISMIMSDKNTMPGHKFRHEVMSEHADSIDIFGMGIFELDRKITGLSPYAFSVVVESERRNGYFTEKLIDCISVGTIPIYWGDPIIGRVFSRRGMIRIDDISDVPYAISMAVPEYYNDLFPFVKKNYDLASQYRICEDQIYLRYPWMFE